MEDPVYHDNYKKGARPVSSTRWRFPRGATTADSSSPKGEPLRTAAYDLKTELIDTHSLFSCYYDSNDLCCI